MDADLFGYRKDEAAIALLQKHESCALDAPRGRTEDHHGYHVAFSGGKDSVVLLDLVKRSGVDYKAYYAVTTCDPPELVRFIKKEYPEVIFVRHNASMWKMIAEKKGMPTRLTRWCCDVFKERHGEGHVIATGIRSAESSSRSKREQVELCYNQKNGYMFVHPIINWHKEDVWAYIELRGLSYCSLYDEGFARLGCVGCPIGNKHDRRISMERWPKIWGAWKRACFKRWEIRADEPNSRGMFKGRTYRDRWPTPQHYWEWWLEEETDPQGDGGLFT